MYTAAKKWDEVDVNGPSKRPNQNSHVPVLVREVLPGRAYRPGGRPVDCPVGRGGRASPIWDPTGPDGWVMGIDQDEEAIAAPPTRLEPYAGRARLIRGNFRELKQHLRSVGLSEVDGVVFDLGVSSAQLDRPDRGFSFLADGPLDMRMDRRGDRTAAELLNQLGETELADLLYQFGEERYSRRIARAVVRARARRPLQTTFDLVSLIRDAVPVFYRHGRLHYATRTFQALRIAVNHELEVLEESFRDAADVLVPGGRLCVISFHSLEDRIAKQTFRALSHGQEPCLATLTKKPCVASEQERREKTRAPSAKLGGGERLPHPGGP